MRRKEQHFASSSCCMFSSNAMKYELKPHLRIQAQCKVLVQIFPPAVLCSVQVRPFPDKRASRAALRIGCQGLLHSQANSKKSTFTHLGYVLLS